MPVSKDFKTPKDSIYYFQVFVKLNFIPISQRSFGLRLKFLDGNPRIHVP
jgi:hypothetical protein